jgi:hypothetical protein
MTAMSFYGVACLQLLMISCAVARQPAARDDDVREIVDAPPSEDPERPDIPAAARFARNKRDVTCGTETMLTSSQQLEALYAHNIHRGQEPAADELRMTWDDNLAALAQAWTNQCQWKHGMLTDCTGNRVGQNMYMKYSSSGFPAVNLTYAVTRWNDERQNWDFASGQCLAGQVCGHWTQVAWSTSSLVGCGLTLCPTVNMSGTIINNAVIVTCDYSPPGNVVGKPFYTTGEPCSACWKITRQQTMDRGYKCLDNLCVPCSPDSDPDCDCGPADSCLNGGIWSSDTCSCQCTADFYGANCQLSCVNVNSQLNCNYWSGLGYCQSDSKYYSYMKLNCAATCNLCF